MSIFENSPMTCEHLNKFLHIEYNTSINIMPSPISNRDGGEKKPMTRSTTRSLPSWTPISIPNEPVARVRQPSKRRPAQKKTSTVPGTQATSPSRNVLQQTTEALAYTHERLNQVTRTLAQCERDNKALSERLDLLEQQQQQSPPVLKSKQKSKKLNPVGRFITRGIPMPIYNTK
jgi:septal ring factor EnvC (AmiA/AmiB activator)